jgi:hypothetical protein
VAVSAIDVISPAFERMKRQLFPFRFGQWLRLAIVGFLTGEMGGGGNGLRFLTNIPGSLPSRQQQFQLPGLGARGMAFVIAVSVVIVLGLILAVIFLYINSRMRFVLFDSIINGECRIRESWRRRGSPGYSYFIWQLVFGLTALVVLAIVVGVPVLLVFRAGVFQNPGQHIPVLVLGGLIVFFLFFVWLIVFGIGSVLTKDFVVPQMALENVTAVEGWRRLWPMMTAEKGGYAGYVGMKILLAIAAAIVLGIIGIILLLVILIPVGGVGVFAVLGGRAAGLTWNPLTIAIAIVFGLIIFLAVMLLSALVSVPAIVFFPSYSIYFLADRYEPLRMVLYPPAPPDVSNPVPQA